MKDREGQSVPSVTFKTRADGEFVDVTTEDIFNVRTVAVFALPGAFTPTCSSIDYLAYINYLVLDATGHSGSAGFALMMTGFVLPLTVVTLVVCTLRASHSSAT